MCEMQMILQCITFKRLTRDSFGAQNSNNDKKKINTLVWKALLGITISFRNDKERKSDFILHFHIFHSQEPVFK